MSHKRRWFKRDRGTVRKCLTSGKVRFRNENQAMSWSRSHGYVQRAYYHQECAGYHLTSHYMGDRHEST